MTIIVAMHEPGVGTWIGSDTLVTAGLETVGFAEKWVMREGCAAAICGSGAVLSIVSQQMTFDADVKPTDLVKNIADLLSARGFKPEAKEGEPPYHGFSMLFVTPEVVASIDSGGSVVTRFIGGFAARGSGANYAEGAAWAMARSGFKPKEIIEGAIAAAMAHCRGCGGEPFIHCLKVPA